MTAARDALCTQGVPRDAITRIRATLAGATTETSPQDRAAGDRDA